MMNVRDGDQGIRGSGDDESLYVKGPSNRQKNGLIGEDGYLERSREEKEG
jgi:hypothetical protein